MQTRSAAPSSGRIPSLDGLRAISILLVITDHLGLGLPYSGRFGVQVFFVISGYLITRLLQEEHERRGRIDLAAFYMRRSFRIFPAAFVFIAVTALLGPPARRDLAYVLTYTMSYHVDKSSEVFSHLWSLSVEEQFYLLWPMALVLGFRFRGRIALIAFATAAFFRLACTIIVPPREFAMLHFWFPSMMDGIAAGCLLAIYEPQVRRACSGLVNRKAVLIILSTAAYLIAYGFSRISFVRPKLSLPLGFSVVFWGIVPLLIAGCIFLAIERGDWILNNFIASAIGVLSYSLYLWQQPFTLSHDSAIWLDLFFLVTLAASSYFAVEKPMIAIGRRLARRVAQSRSVLCANDEKPATATT